MEHHVDLKKFEKCHVLVIGDIMLDRYLWGDVHRISPEAPVPVFHIKERSELTGGAGNVVSNLVGLGCSVTAIGVCGDDEAGERLNGLLGNGKIQKFILKDLERPTVTKTRIISSGQQLLRLDEEESIPLNSKIQDKLLNLVNDNLSNCNAIVLSDYGKGVLQTPGLSQSIINLAQSHNIPVMVDPKGKDWIRYKGATCVTPNTKELEIFYGGTIDGKETLVEAMRSILADYNLTWLLVTRGPLGMCLMSQDEGPIFISALAREVYDVSGAGDTVIATLSLGVASGFTFQDAAKIANLAAGIVVGKLGTQAINLLELKVSLGMNGAKISGNYINKITSLSAAKIQVQAWQANGEKIVFTNGCFDLLHPGHIHLLYQSKELGDRLIVGLNSDASVQRLKGKNRPILNEHDRASILGALDCVDQVVLFDKDTPKDLLEAMKPNILVKGSDYTLDKVVEREIVESYGGDVRLIPILKGYSTTDITNNILKAHK
jgi:D-beta-D-heptose 7-phosphate kinase / D-beta-D-heptose 1-phosphate adenosyltransferase